VKPPTVPEPPNPPDEWLAEHTGPGSKASAGFGWQAGWRVGWVAGYVAKPARHSPGPMHRALRADLVALGLARARGSRLAGRAAGRATLTQLAVVLADAIDGSDTPTTTAKLAQELRAVLGKLTGESAGDDDGGAFGAHMSTPVV